MSHRFLLDRMLGNLATWLRMLNHDTLYAEEEDDLALLRRAREEERVLLTCDGPLAERARREGLPVVHLRSRETLDQLREIQEALGPLGELGMERCSLCNHHPLRAAQPADLEGKDYIPRHPPPGGLWCCPRCRQVYWKGGHWESIERRLRGL